MDQPELHHRIMAPGCECLGYNAPGEREGTARTWTQVNKHRQSSHRSGWSDQHAHDLKPRGVGAQASSSTAPSRGPWSASTTSRCRARPRMRLMRMTPTCWSGAAASWWPRAPTCPPPPRCGLLLRCMLHASFENWGYQPTVFEALKCWPRRSCGLDCCTPCLIIEGAVACLRVAAQHAAHL